MSRACGSAEADLRDSLQAARGDLAAAARCVGAAFLCVGSPEVLRQRLRTAQVALHRADCGLLTLIGGDGEH